MPREIADIDVELIDATMAHIESNPHLHEQGSWFASGGRACFAGRVALVSGAQFPPPEVWDRGMPWTLNPDGTYNPGGLFTDFADVTSVVSVFTWSQRKLGLTTDQARALFSPLRTIESLRVLVDLLKRDPEVDETEMVAVAHAYEAVEEGAYAFAFASGRFED